MAVLVQKFGGTSVSTRQGREAATARVLVAKQQGQQLVVVISAMGRNGAPYATDTLAALVDAEQGFDRRDLDLVLMCGEIISTGMFVAHLRRHLERVAMLTGWQAGIVTEDNHGDARIVDIRPGRIQRLLAEGYVVAVAGFQGISGRGEITTLGRGGSDTTAAALGAALNASLVEIYTDVDGIMTADPKLVPSATVLPLLDYAQALQLANAGAKVLHPRAVEMAMRRNIPLVVKNTGGNHPGTRVGPILPVTTISNRVLFPSPASLVPEGAPHC